jgi:hypothetical protein
LCNPCSQGYRYTISWPCPSSALPNVCTVNTDSPTPSLSLQRFASLTHASAVDSAYDWPFFFVIYCCNCPRLFASPPHLRVHSFTIVKRPHSKSKQDLAHLTFSETTNQSTRHRGELFLCHLETCERCAVALRQRSHLRLILSRSDLSPCHLDFAIAGNCRVTLLECCKI